MTSSLSFQCPTCSGQNAPDSRFCRHCGGALEGASPAAPSAPAANPVQTPEAGPATGQGGAQSVSADIDARRARQLLERAHTLSDQGESAGAILACRQSIALAPGMAAGHTMLGRLLERSGDTVQALAAYERALRIAPDSEVQTAVARLHNKMNVEPAAASLFHFNDDELFGGEDESLPALAPPAVLPVPVPVLAASPADLELDALPLSNIGAAAPGLPSANPKATAVETGRAIGVPLAAAALAQNIPGQPPRSALSGAAPPYPVSSGAPRDVRPAPFIAAPATPLPLHNPVQKSVNWNSLWTRSSYFGRSLPLVGATIVALGFLSWARGLALARTPVATTSAVVAPAGPSLAPVPVDSSLANPNSNAALQSSPPVGSGSAANDGFPISNQPFVAAPAANPGTTNVGANGAANGSNRAANVPLNNNSLGNNRRIVAVPRSQRSAEPRFSPPRTAPPRFVPSIAPAPVPAPSNARNSNAGAGNAGAGNSSDFTLPAPVISSPAPDTPATSVLPSGNSTPLNPAGASGRGYVRITQGRIRSALPQSSSARAGADERAAADAARAGSTDRAIDGLTAAINANSSDAGYRFQQRASLFLQRGDYSRAADDFQAAISAYNDQITRGEQVAAARAGLRAARGGLNLALAGGR